ncbi:MAG: hypothetical protein R3293_22225, partial [Candidatus Promineifilaceae bacterium]|nr:hypothetical protein [Candidatus Promineifilaceae bacterium]
MSEDLSLKKAERRAWTLYYEDGLWDIFLGLMFLGGGLRTLTDNLWFYLFILAGPLVVVLGRMKMTLPRIGVIKFGTRRKQRRRVLIVVIVIAVILTFLLMLIPALGIAAPGAAAGYVLALTVPLVFVYMAYLLEFRRLYGYAVLVAATMILTEVVGVRAGAWAQVITGTIALLVGLWHLVHFLRSYPIPEKTVM